MNDAISVRKVSIGWNYLRSGYLVNEDHFFDEPEEMLRYVLCTLAEFDTITGKKYTRRDGAITTREIEVAVKFNDRPATEDEEREFWS